MTSSDRACVSLQTAACPSRGFCGWLNALRFGGSASNFIRILAEDRNHNHHRLSSSHWLVSKASASFLRSFDFPFSSISAGLKHGFFRRLSWCCIRLCLIFSLGGVVSPAPRVMGAVLSAALPGITLATAASAAVYSQGGVSRVSSQECGTTPYQWSGSSCTTQPWSRCPPGPCFALALASFNGSLRGLLRVQRLFTGFPALPQLCVDGGISCSTPSRAMMPSSGSRSTRRKVHAAGNVSSICSRMPNTSPDCGFVDLVRSRLRQRQHSPLLGLRAHALDHATMRLHDALHRSRHLRHLNKVGVVLLQHRDRGLEGVDPPNSKKSPPWHSMENNRLWFRSRESDRSASGNSFSSCMKEANCFFCNAVASSNGCCLLAMSLCKFSSLQ